MGQDSRERFRYPEVGGKVILTRAEWTELDRHGYTHRIDGNSYIVILDQETGATVLAPCEVTGELEKVIARGKQLVGCDFCEREDVDTQSHYEGQRFCSECYPMIYRYGRYVEGIESMGEDCEPVPYAEWAASQDRAQVATSAYWNAYAQHPERFG